MSHNFYVKNPKGTSSIRAYKHSFLSCFLMKSDFDDKMIYIFAISRICATQYGTKSVLLYVQLEASVFRVSAKSIEI